MPKQKNNQQPDYVTHSDENSITIDISKWQGKQEVNITIDDLIKFYATEAKEDKELKNLAGIYGDQTNINKLAEEATEYFKKTNWQELANKASKKGIFFGE